MREAAGVGWRWPRQEFSDTGGSAPAGGDFGGQQIPITLRTESQNYNHTTPRGVFHTYQSTAALENCKQNPVTPHGTGRTRAFSQIHRLLIVAVLDTVEEERGLGRNQA
jgi:hypothetical protein